MKYIILYQDCRTDKHDSVIVIAATMIDAIKQVMESQIGHTSIFLACVRG
jgi:hypothetical protein